MNADDSRDPHERWARAIAILLAAADRDPANHGSPSPAPSTPKPKRPKGRLRSRYRYNLKAPLRERATWPPAWWAHLPVRPTRPE